MSSRLTGLVAQSLVLMLMCGQLAVAEDAIPGIVPIDASKATSKLMVQDMPAVTTQGGMPICFAAVASVLLDKENCRFFEQQCRKKGGQDCANKCATVAATGKFSPLGLADYGFSITDEQGDDIPQPRFANGGHPVNVLQLVSYLTESAPSDSCMSVDSLFRDRPGHGATLVQVEALAALRKRYQQYQKRKKQCGECAARYFKTAAAETNKAFNLGKRDEDMLRAFDQDTEENFLSKLFRPVICNRASKRTYLENSENLVIKGLPEMSLKDAKTTYKESIATIRQVLGDQRPLALANVCLQNKPPKRFKSCTNPHAFVVSGYASVCDARGKNCKDALRIQNSWGQAWQDSISVKNAAGQWVATDSWIEAKPLLDRSTYDETVLSWFEDKPPEIKERKIKIPPLLQAR